MKISIEKFEMNKTTEQKDVEFPFHGWWDANTRRESIVKLELVKYTHIDAISHVKVTKVSMGFARKTIIESDTLSVSNGIFPRELSTILVDYDNKTTAEAFNNFFEQAVNELKGITKQD